jgi:phosphoribosyl 1,2-cyclic phosphodiesterase
MTSKISVKFWGARGSIPCPGPGTLRYGGNTACVEVRCGGRLLIFDGGTGIRELGDALMKSGETIDADIFLSHCHIDHIGGFPFFAPFFSEKHRFRLWAGNLAPPLGVRKALAHLMSPPIFPIGIDAFRAAIDYRDFRAGKTLQPFSGATLRTAPLHHPDGATGYALDHDGRTIAYLTDNEEPAGDFDAGLVALARGADLAIYDCTFTEEEIASKRGWGHSTWRGGLRLADAAGVKTLCLFHHAPEHDDAFMDRILTAARAARPGTIAAIEGAVIEL